MAVLDRGADNMSTEFYYSMERGKKRFLSDDNLDSESFDFMQNFASWIDEIRVGSISHSEFCLSVINASSENLSHWRFGSISKTGDA